MAQNIHSSSSPLKVSEGSKIIKVTLPTETTSITSLNLQPITILDVSLCAKEIQLAGMSTTNLIASYTLVEYSDGTKDGFDLTDSIYGNISYGSRGATVTPTSSITSCTDIVKLVIGNKITSILQYAFYNCKKLKYITIPTTVTVIGGSAFCYCDFESVNIPDSVTELLGSCFWGCSSLTEITIPASVKTIGTNSFRDCTKLAKIVFDGTEYTSLSALTTAFEANGTNCSSEAFTGCSVLNE